MLSRLFSSCGEWEPLSSCGVWASHGSGISRCGAETLGARASVVLSCGPSRCGLRAWLLCSLWDLLGSQIKHPCLLCGQVDLYPLSHLFSLSHSNLFMRWMRGWHIAQLWIARDDSPLTFFMDELIS